MAATGSHFLFLYFFSITVLYDRSGDIFLCNLLIFILLLVFNNQGGPKFAFKSNACFTKILF